MLSANALSEHEAQARDAGADVHIAKPITAENFVAGIARALDRAG
jgi:CheY-like chemotaxis protein